MLVEKSTLKCIASAVTLSHTHTPQVLCEQEEWSCWVHFVHTSLCSTDSVKRRVSSMDQLSDTERYRQTSCMGSNWYCFFVFFVAASHFVFIFDATQSRHGVEQKLLVMLCKTDPIDPALYRISVL